MRPIYALQKSITCLLIATFTISGFSEFKGCVQFLTYWIPLTRYTSDIIKTKKLSSAELIYFNRKKLFIDIFTGCAYRIRRYILLANCVSNFFLHLCAYRYRFSVLTLRVHPRTVAHTSANEEAKNDFLLQK